MTNVFVKSGLVLFLILVVFAPLQAYATPTIALYFDKALTQQSAECPSDPIGSVLDTVYVAISGFSTPVEGIEYSIQFPQEILFLGELDSHRSLWMGDPATGVSVAFFTPVDASGPVIIQEFVVLWLCQGCETTNIPIEFAAHPMTGSLRAVTSDLVFEDVYGFTSMICVTCLFCSPEQSTTNRRTVLASSMAEQCVLDCPAGDGGVILPGGLPAEHHSPDLDNDGLVNIVDFALFAQAYLPMIFDSDMDYYCTASLDLIDFVLFTRHWLHTGSVPVERRTWGDIKERYSD